MEDEKKGCFTRPLRFIDAGDFKKTIETMRRCPTLPVLLGRDRGDEGVSDLALHTVSHALFVALSVLRSAKVPFARSLAVARAPLLPISGITSRSWWYRIPVALAFAAAVAFLAARLGTRTPKAGAPLGALWSRALLLNVVAVLGAAGVAAVPVVRMWKAQPEPRPPTAAQPPERREVAWRRRFVQGLWFLGMAGPVVAMFVIGWAGRGLGLSELLAGPGSEEPPGWVVGLALGAVFGVAAALRGLKVIRPIQAQVASLLTWVPAWLLALIGAAAVLYWSVPVLWAVWDDGDWRWLIVALGAASVVVALVYLLRRRHLWDGVRTALDDASRLVRMRRSPRNPFRGVTVLRQPTLEKVRELRAWCAQRRTR